MKYLVKRRPTFHKKGVILTESSFKKYYGVWPKDNALFFQEIEEPVQAANTELPVTEAAPVNMAATLPQNYDDSTTSVKTADTSPIEVLLEVKPKLEPVASAQYMERAARLKGLRWFPRRVYSLVL